MTPELERMYSEIWKKNKIKCTLKEWLGFVEELNSTKSCKASKFPDNKHSSDPI